MEAKSKKELTEAELIAYRNVYHSFLSYMEEFRNTFGFTLAEQDEPYEVTNAYELFFKLRHDLDYEFIDLKRTVYDKLFTFIDKEVSETIEWSTVSGISDFDEINKESKAIHKRLMDSFQNILGEYLV